MADKCEFSDVCEDFTVHNQKCTDTTAFCVMRVQLTYLQEKERGSR